MDVKAGQDGILNICKPTGMSSFKCLSIVKHGLGIKKVGHLGTLDPAACGVLVLLCGKYTKWAEYLHGRAPHPDGKTVCKKVCESKVYRSVFTFGIETESLDNEGALVAENDNFPTREQIEAVLPAMVGEIEIEVPKFSAVHIGGRRAYELARKGVDFTAPRRVVNIKRFELLKDFEHLELCRNDKLGAHEFFFEIECQTGTYIRSLAKQLAQQLSSSGASNTAKTYLAIASSIIRTRVGEFDIKDAKTLEDVATEDLKQFEDVMQSKK